MHATTWITWKTLHLVKEVSQERLHVVSLHLYEIPKVDKFMEPERRLVVFQGWSRAEGCSRNGNDC